VAIKHWGVPFVLLEDEDDVVEVWEAEEVVWVNEVVEDSVAEETVVVVDNEDVAEVEVVWGTTVNCVWFGTVTFPLLAETYVVYWP
jgi:hypothetical protein